MRELRAIELDQVSGGVKGEFSMEAGVNKDGPFVMGRLKIEFGRDEKPNSGQDQRRAPSGGDEPAFTATAMRP